MLAAYTTLQHAQKVKEFLVKHNLLNQQYSLVKELEHLYFPILKKVNIPLAKVVNTKFSFPIRSSELSLETLLKNKLTKKELELLPKSQEIVGQILILEIPEELHKKEKIIAQAYLKYHKTIETVVKKKAMHEGLYRLRKVTILAGKKTKETIHSENGIKLKLHLEKTYFSARSNNERLRIAKLVKESEDVLVMFSGAGPYPLVIAKNSLAKKVYGIEINPLAHQYALTNIALNKLEERVIIYEGDARKIAPSLHKKFDRIVMPLPKTSEEFLDLALPLVKEGGHIHLYSFLREDEIEPEAKRIVLEQKKRGWNIKIKNKVTCGQFAPHVFRICFDLELMKRKKEMKN